MVDTVLLGNNNLSSLEGIQQFIFLKSLSLANNRVRLFIENHRRFVLIIFLKITEISSLKPLVDLSIESLYLEGNPITQRPSYRQHVITLLPSLKFLNSLVSITKNELTFNASLVSKTI